LLKQDEPALIERGREVAAANHIYLGMTLMTVNPGQPKPVENKLVMITPAGEVAWQYHKTRLTPSFEMTYEVKGDGQLRSLDTPYGRLSGLICFDADFPRFVAQEGSRVHADMVIDPSGDWLAIDPIHTQMASFRAIEQGFNMVRQTRTGLSAAYDYQGHRLAAMDHFKTTDHTLISLVPVRGTRTIYSRLGDWFAWLCIAGFAAIVLETRRRAPAKMAQRPSGEGGRFAR